MKEIPNYPGYLVSEEGKVFTLKVKGGQGKSFSEPKEMIYRITRGYRRVGLRNNTGKKKNFKVNRLVAELFIPNPKNLPIVLHKDNNKINNHFSNLKWGTHQDNSTQMVEEGRQNSPILERNSSFKYGIDICKKIKEELKKGTRMIDICNKFEISKKQVIRIRNNKTVASRLC